MDTRILNKPVRLNWAGWETDTYQLGRLGWQISAKQDVYRNTMGIAINHPHLQIQGISIVEEFLFRELMEGRCAPRLPITLQFQTMAREVYINTVDSQEIGFSAVDFQPTVCESRITKLEDFANFKTISEVPKNAIYLKEANIDQILQMALKKQAPEQDRIRQEVLRQQELQSLRMGTLHTELRLVA